MPECRLFSVDEGVFFQVNTAPAKCSGRAYEISVEKIVERRDVTRPVSPVIMKFNQIWKPAGTMIHGRDSWGIHLKMFTFSARIRVVRVSVSFERSFMRAMSAVLTGLPVRFRFT